MKQIVITILPDGTSTVDAQGFKGQQCSLATKEIELALAGNASGISDKKKPEFAMNPGTQGGTNYNRG